MDRRPTPSPGHEYARHIQAVLERDREIRAAEAFRPPPRQPLLLRGPVMGVTAVLFGAVLAYNARAWNPTPPPQPRIVQETSLQVSVLVASQMIESYRRENGRLPASLAEVGLPEDAFTYRTFGDEYEIFASGEDAVVRYDSELGPEGLLRHLPEPVIPGGGIP